MIFGSASWVKFRFLAVIGAVTILGYIVTRSLAAGPLAAFEPETGSLSAGSSIQSQAGSSGNGVVKFAASSSTTPTPSPTVVPSSLEPFASTSPWNAPLPANATWRDEPLLRSNHWYVNSTQYSMPYAIAAPSDPMVSITVPASWGWPAGPVSMAAPSGLTGDAGTDKTVIIQNGTKVCDFWHFIRGSDTTATSSSYGCTDAVTGSGFGTSSPFKSAGIRAAGASALGGLLQGHNFTTGVKRQALAVSLLGTLLKKGWVSPAIAEDGNSGTNYKGTIPMGARIGIPAGISRPTGMTSGGNMVWDTLQTYGAYVVDQNYGTNPVVLYADPRSTSSTQVAPLRVWWNGAPADLDLIMPHVRVLE